MNCRLKEIRESRGMTQEELEKKSGVSRQTISAIENRKTIEIKSGTILKLAKALETSIDEIFFSEAV